MPYVEASLAPPPVILDWPDPIKFAPVFPHWENATNTGGRTLTGKRQSTINEFGFWTLRLRCWFKGLQAEMVWQAVMAMLNGSGGAFRIPLCGLNISPHAAAQPSHRAPAPASVPHSDKTFFSDGSGYRGRSLMSMVTAAAPLAGNSVTASLAGAPAYQAGQFFTHKDNLYRIASAVRQETDWKLVIQGILAEAASIGDHLEFEYPTVVMQLTDDGQGEPAWDEGAKEWRLDLELEQAW